MKLGIDIGSVTAKAVILDEANYIIENCYTRTRGQPVETILAILEDMLSRYSPEQFELAATTGTGGRLVFEPWDLGADNFSVNDIESTVGMNALINGTAVLVDGTSAVHGPSSSSNLYFYWELVPAITAQIYNTVA